jgi:hypothetical protein
VQCERIPRQSNEHTLRALDKFADHEQERGARLKKTLANYQAQANKPFDHEARMKDLLVRQAQLNAVLDLDKGETQIAAPAEIPTGAYFGGKFVASSLCLGQEKRTMRETDI